MVVVAAAALDGQLAVVAVAVAVVVVVVAADFVSPDEFFPPSSARCVPALSSEGCPFGTLDTSAVAGTTSEGS